MSDSKPSTIEQAAYDRVPYTAHPYFQTQPSRSAATAQLFGLQAVPVAGARVLEVGCALGGNCIPLAEQFPETTFFGIDISAAQIDGGKARIAALGLTNIRLEQADILDFSTRDLQFDYIIAHGVYSWVPTVVQDALLRLCGRMLAPHGIAYVSYNVYPGWHLKNITRSMMLFHAKNLAPDADVVPEARALLKDVASQIDGMYGKVLKAELAANAKLDDAYLQHEHLEHNNEPVYFLEFLTAAQRHGLEFLSEADPTTSLPDSFSPDIAQSLRRVAGDNTMMLEQYIDFYVGRQFRSTLLVRREFAGSIKRSISTAVIAGLSIAPRAPLTKVFVPTMDASATLRSRYVVYRSSVDEITVSEPLAIAVLDVLERRGHSNPATLTLTELLQAALPTRDATAAEREAVGELVLELFRRKMIWFFSEPISAMAVSDRPCTRRLSRHDARTGAKITTNLAHEKIAFANDQAREFIQLLDGTRTRDEIEAEILRRAQVGKFELALHDQPAAADADLPELAHAHVEYWLQTYANLKMLVTPSDPRNSG